MLDNCENANLNQKYCSTSSYFVIDENNNLIGAGSLRHYLTIDGFNSWGHTGYGVRPSARNKGYGTQIEKLLLKEAKKMNILKVLVGVHNSNIASIRVIEKCGGVLENVVHIPEDSESIRKYWIDNK